MVDGWRWFNGRPSRFEGDNDLKQPRRGVVVVREMVVSLLITIFIAWYLDGLYHH